MYYSLQRRIYSKWITWPFVKNRRLTRLWLTNFLARRRRPQHGGITSFPTQNSIFMNETAVTIDKLLRLIVTSAFFDIFVDAIPATNCWWSCIQTGIAELLFSNFFLFHFFVHFEIPNANWTHDLVLTSRVLNIFIIVLNCTRLQYTYSSRKRVRSSRISSTQRRR